MPILITKMVNTNNLIEILHTHFRILRKMLVNMRQLQRVLVTKDFKMCDRLVEDVKDGHEMLKATEQKRMRILTPYALEKDMCPEDIKGDELIAYVPALEKRTVRVLLSQIKEVSIHIQLLSHSITRFSNAIGSAMGSAFEEIISTKEYTYTRNGTPPPRVQDPLLCDSTR